MREPATTPRLSGVAVFFYVFLPFALGHYLSTLLRNVNAVLAPDLMGSLALTPGELGLLTSAFFVAFALVQLPVGIALDRWGPRRVQLAMMLVGAIGALLFARATCFGQLVVARAIRGLGLGGCFMAAGKAVSPWLPQAQLPSVQSGSVFPLSAPHLLDYYAAQEILDYFEHDFPGLSSSELE